MSRKLALMSTFQFGLEHLGLTTRTSTLTTNAIATKSRSSSNARDGVGGDDDGGITETARTLLVDILQSAGLGKMGNGG